MAEFTQKPLCFHPSNGKTIRANFNAGLLSSDFGVLLLPESGLSGKLITAILRPGKTPTGKENAAVLKRLIELIRQSWPKTIKSIVQEVQISSGSVAGMAISHI